VGCGDDQECALDTDCDLFQICVAERCVARGTRTDGGSSEAGPSDAGGDDGGGLDAAVDAGPTVTRAGAVYVTQTPIPMLEPNHLVSATFTETTGTATACTETTMGSCTLRDCFFPMAPADAGMPVDAGMPTFPSAGPILVDGDPTDVMLTPEANGTYPAASGTGQIWGDGAMVAVTADGADVPAFSSTLVGPSGSSVGSPSFMTPPVMIDRAMPFTLTWSGGSGTMQGQLVNNVIDATGTQTVIILCSFDAAAGTGTIPAELLEQVPTGDAAAFLVNNVVDGLPDVTGWTVTVRLTTPAQLDNGSSGATVTLTDSTP
jgi:hypothetical protein